ncbi:hypothetical protein AB0A74_07130 [Saccharothrix sp. NPDC042600]|uniref:hypothetical protein n=1 Tax=Saccharothrix TaxID=2071 RepID=UPI00340A1433
MDTLIQRRLAELGHENMSVAALERLRGLRPGTLAYPLRPERRGKWPSATALTTWAQALELDVTTVSRAFATDLDGVAGAYTPEQRQMLVLMDGLDAEGQRAAVQLVQALADYAHCRTPRKQPPSE